MMNTLEERMSKLKDLLGKGQLCDSCRSQEALGPTTVPAFGHRARGASCCGWMPPQGLDGVLFFFFFLDGVLSVLSLPQICSSMSVP